MPKQRNPENQGLPKRWRFTRNAYYYQVPPGQEFNWEGKQTFKLGNTLPSAYRTWAERLEVLEEAKTINDLLDRYALEIIPTKAVSTQYDNALYTNNLKKVFGRMQITAIEPVHIYQYLDKRSKKKSDGTGGLTIAKREIAMLSDAFTKAVRWGLIRKHPFKGEVVYKSEKPRTRYIENWELDAFLSLSPKRRKDPTRVIQAYTNLKVLTGLRQQDLLSLKVTDLKEDGVHVTPLKTKNSTGKSFIIEWTATLRKSINLALSVRPVDLSPYVFCTRRGFSYYHPEKASPATGWQSMWKRYMKRAVEETDLTEHFTEHDLRAKTASDLDNVEHAQRLLAHADIKITQRVYRRKPEKVKPAR